jgi:hypothetical protein
LFETVGKKNFINLGDWMEHFTYCQFDEGGPRLLTWPEQKPYFATTPSFRQKSTVPVQAL